MFLFQQDYDLRITGFGPADLALGVLANPTDEAPVELPGAKPSEVNDKKIAVDPKADGSRFLAQMNDSRRSRSVSQTKPSTLSDDDASRRRLDRSRQSSAPITTVRERWRR